MKKNLYLVQKPVRLTCSWVVTGDDKKPLVCVWGASAAASVAAVTVSSEEVRMHLCA